MQFNFTIYIQGHTKYYQHGVKDEAKTVTLKKIMIPHFSFIRILEESELVL